jgi:hypothetical protein
LSFRTDLLALVDSIRELPDTSFDLRLNEVSIITRTWSTEYVGQDGVYEDSVLVLPKKYPVRHVSIDEVTASGGQYRLQDVKVKHITPFDGIATGYTPEQLAPPITADNVQVIYVITGPLAGEYERIHARFDRSFSYELTLRRVLETP